MGTAAEERCESGRIGLTANELTWATGSEGSNPSLSALWCRETAFAPSRDVVSASDGSPMQPGCRDRRDEHGDRRPAGPDHRGRWVGPRSVSPAWLCAAPAADLAVLRPVFHRPTSAPVRQNFAPVMASPGEKAMNRIGVRSGCRWLPLPDGSRPVGRSVGRSWLSPCAPRSCRSAARECSRSGTTRRPDRRHCSPARDCR